MNAPAVRHITLTTRARRTIVALGATMAFNALMFWTLATWNQPAVFDPPPEAATRLVFTTEPTPRIPEPSEPESEPEPPPPVMEVNLEFTPQPPTVDVDMEMELDLSVPSVDTVYVPVPPVVQAPAPVKPAPAAPKRPAQPAPQRPSGPMNAEQVDQPPRELTNLLPAYPPRAARLGRTGYVTLKILIDERGQVEQVQIVEVQGHRSFRDAVLDVARRYRFTPARYRGQPVKVWATKTIRFELGG